MTKFLLGKFVKNYENIADAKVRAAYGSLSGVIGIVLNCLLCAFKFAAGFFAGSAAIISDAANNLSDVASVSVSLVGFKLAAKPADEKHPFGHGRYEYVLSLVISFFVLLMGAELFKSAVQKIIHPDSLRYSPLIVAVLCVSILIKLLMGFFNRSLYKKSAITALKAVSVDSFSDCIGTAAVLAGILIYRFFAINADAYIGAAVSLLVIRSGIDILRESLQPILGKPADKETVEQLKRLILESDSAILGVHDMMLHDYGMGKIFAVAHVEVPAHCDLVSIHAVADSIEKQAEARFGVSLVLHIDPVDESDERLQRLEAQVLTIVKSVDEHYTLHDFRLSADEKQMFFDLVIDDDIAKDNAAIADMVKLRIQAALGDAPEPVIKVEYSFTGN